MRGQRVAPGANAVHSLLCWQASFLVVLCAISKASADTLVTQGQWRKLSDSDPVSTVSRPGETKVLQLAAYWGQNSVGQTRPTVRPEPTLGEICGDYDIVVIAFLRSFGNAAQPIEDPVSTLDGVPYVVDNTIHAPQQTGPDIGFCQRKGVKIFVSLGGPVAEAANGSAAVLSENNLTATTCPYGFRDDDDAKSTAFKVWNSFLGGSGAVTRPFGAIALDGIDLDIRCRPSGRSSYAAFISQLRKLMDADSSKPYYITARVDCTFPDPILGPVNTSQALTVSAYRFDYLWLQFYGSGQCAWANGGKNFTANDTLIIAFDTWARWAGSVDPPPLLFVNLPAAPGAGTGFIPSDAAASLINFLNTRTNYGGVMLWDVGWDVYGTGSNSSADAPRYGQSLRGVLASAATLRANKAKPADSSAGGTAASFGLIAALASLVLGILVAT